MCESHCFTQWSRKITDGLSADLQLWIQHCVVAGQLGVQVSRLHLWLCVAGVAVLAVKVKKHKDIKTVLVGQNLHVLVRPLAGPGLPTSSCVLVQRVDHYCWFLYGMQKKKKVNQGFVLLQKPRGIDESWRSSIESYLLANYLHPPGLSWPSAEAWEGESSIFGGQLKNARGVPGIYPLGNTLEVGLKVAPPHPPNHSWCDFFC